MEDAPVPKGLEALPAQSALKQPGRPEAGAEGNNASYPSGARGACFVPEGIYRSNRPGRGQGDMYQGD